METTIGELATILMVAFVLGWFCAITSGALFSYIVFRTKKEQHESFFPRKTKKRGGPVNIDEFATDANAEEEAMPDIIKRQNERLVSSIHTAALKKGKSNG